MNHKADKQPRNILKPLSGELQKLASTNAEVNDDTVAKMEDAQVTREDDLYVPEGFHFINTESRTRKRWGANDAGKVDDDDDDWDDDDRVDDGLDGLDVLEDFVESTGFRGDLTKRVRALQSSGKAVQALEKGIERRRENRSKDRMNRATVEQVLDPRTRTILFKLLGRGKLLSIGGCVSTGKEANVYFGTGPPVVSSEAIGDYASEAVAIKIFKTSILQFKDRERYVDGEHRFRRQGYNRSSPRKMVQQWAEKEFRNLARLRAAGILAPLPLILKPPVLVMTFFGRDGWPAPRLKDAGLSPRRLYKCYDQVVIIMRRMWKAAKLVHGDLSEYNLLYEMGQVVVIDVSQSVEGEHPMAFDFLRRDCLNINDFFRKSNVNALLSLKELFTYIISENGIDLDELRAASAARGEMDDKQAADDAVFAACHLPRGLRGVGILDENVGSGPQEQLTRVEEDVISVSTPSKDHEEKEDDDESLQGGIGGKEPQDTGGEGVTESDAPSEGDLVNGKTFEESGLTRKEWKTKVKAETRERRKEKTPKHEKKRKKTLAKRRKGMKARK